MEILVTNPTGRIGRTILPELLAPEFSVRVVVRDPARLPEEIREQVTVVRGSADDAATLRRALEGVEAMFWCVPTEPLWETNIERHYERFAFAAWQAVRDAGTVRIVTVSAAGKGTSGKDGPVSGLHGMEEILNESGVAIRHLRCGPFMENLFAQLPSIQKAGLISYPIAGHVPLAMTAVSDIADVALRWLVRRDWSGIGGVSVRGPEDLSFNQIAAVVERIFGQPVQYRQASPSDYIRKLIEVGASPEYARSQVDRFDALAQGIPRAEPRMLESTTATTFVVWAANELLPAFKPHASRWQRAAVSLINSNHDRAQSRPLIGQNRL